MKIIKKIISVLIISAMLPCTAFASVENAASDDGYNKSACDFLIALGIIDDTFGFQFNKEISRMEFARVVLKAAGYSTDGYEPKGIFGDVTEENEYIADIEVLYSLGIVSGDGASFAPARHVTYTEAIIMLLRAAGYTSLVEAMGGYPDGYMTIARNEGLLKNVSADEKFIGDDMVVMVYNMLMLKTLDFSQIGTYKFSETETILSQRHNVYYRKGVVEENEVSALTTTSTAGKGNIILNTGASRVAMAVGDTDIDKMLGYTVVAYYRYDRNAYASECVYYEYESKNNIAAFDISDLKSFKTNKIEYYENGETKTAQTSSTGAIILYNDSYYSAAGPLVTASFKGKVGKITAIDNNLDNIYDVISVEAFDTYVVANAVSKEQCFYDKDSTNGKIDIANEGVNKYSLKMADGKDAVFGDICADMVVSVAKSSAFSKAKTVKVILSTTRASGAVTAVDEEDGKRFVELDDLTRYYLLDRVTGAMLPKVGGGATLLLDAFGNVTYIETRFMADMQYGFLIGAREVKKDDITYIKLLTREGEIVNAPAAQKITIDGKIFKEYTEVYDDIMKDLPTQKVNGAALPQGVTPVRYRLNEKGEVRVLDTPRYQASAGEDANSLQKIDDGSQVYSSGVFGYKIPINGNTTVINFTTPDKTSQEYYEEVDRYSFTGMSAFRDRRIYTYAAYKVDPKAYYADLILYFASSGFEHETGLTVVKKYGTQVYDEEEEETFTVFEGLSEGSTIKCYIAKEFEAAFMALGLKQGDVVRCLTDDKGRLCDIDGPIFTYDPTTDFVEPNNTSNGTAKASDLKNKETSSAVLIGDVSLRNEGLIKLYHMLWGTKYKLSTIKNEIDVKSGDSREEFWVKIDGSVPVMVYDAAETGSDAVYSGTYDDIVAMGDSFKKHSVVILRYRSDALYSVVVINNLYN